jgi:TRAP-type C4-dicarboxylate transport system permease small subunit
MRRVINTLFDVIELYAGALVFVVMFVAVVIQVFFRYVLNTPLPWAFELSMYALVWVTFLTAPYATRYREHIRLDLFYEKFPRKVQIVLDLIFDVFIIVMAALTLPVSIEYTSWNSRVTSACLGIPWSWLLVIFPVFLCLTIIHKCAWIYRLVRELFGKERITKVVHPWR